MIFTLAGRIPSKKNSRKAIYVHGRTIMIPSDAYKAWHEGAEWELVAQMKKLGVKGWTGLPNEKPLRLKNIVPVSIEIVMYAPDLVRGDLTNKAESIMDLMVDVGLLADDNWRVVPELLLRFGGVDRVKPRAEVTIKPFAILKSKVVRKK